MKKIIVKENQAIIIPVLWLGKETELTYEVHLVGRYASVKMVGLLLGKEAQNLALSVKVIHQAKDTKSEIILKSALSDMARVDINGLVTIEKGAKGTNAWLAAHLLLLSEKAKGKAIPSLEILENDIKAGHATTVGRINDLEMFYLQSRGLSSIAAKKLIVEGFLNSMISEFPKSLADKARKAVVV